MESLVELKDVSKSFGSKRVLSAIDINIPRNKVIGLIGPNGSGKTTLINIILGIIKQTQGELVIKSGVKIGSCLLTKGLFTEFSVLRNLTIAQTILGASKEQLYSVIDDFNLRPILSVQFSKLSTGMQQLVALSISFMGDPDLVILDEPINGLDVDHIIFFRSYLESQRQQRAILMTSHILSELEKSCAYAYFIKAGAVTYQGNQTSIINEFGSFENAYLNAL